MFELFAVLLFVYLAINAIGMAMKLTWGAAKIAVGFLVALAFPILIVCFVFAGGIALLLPLAMVGIAAAIVKVCIDT